MATDPGRAGAAPPPRKILEEALLRIAEDWNLAWINAADYKELAIIEGCAHELAHFLDLGVDFEDLLRDMPDAESNKHEASVLRIEASALAALGISLSMRRLRTSANWDGSDGVPSHAELRAPLTRHEQHCIKSFVALATYEISRSARCAEGPSPQRAGSAARDQAQTQLEETMSDARQSTLPGLPDGWTVEHRDGYAVLQHPSTMGGYVTVDWACRGFRGGNSTAGRLTSSKTYHGRGWREVLVRDAVTWLSNVYDSHPARRRNAQ